MKKRVICTFDYSDAFGRFGKGAYIMTDVDYPLTEEQYMGAIKTIKDDLKHNNVIITNIIPLAD